MEPAPPTIPEIKLHFLHIQSQLLSRPLSLPSNYTSRPHVSRPRNDGENTVLAQRSIDRALQEVNAKIKVHGTSVYPEIAQRHVAEQIDQLYWRAAERALEHDTEEQGGALIRGADLADEESISLLPETWPSPSASLSEDYAVVAAQVQSLSAQRAQLRAKVQLYKGIQKQVQAFKNPTETIQPNLCTKNGEIEQELEKMRMLLARVVGRIEGLPAKEPGRGEDEEEEDMTGEVDDESRIRALLSLT